MSANTSIEWTDRTWRTAAKRAGISLDQYRANVEAGLKFCWRCRGWKPVGSFGIDRSRWDGLAARCVSCRRPPKQLPLIRETPAEYERRRYATNADYRHRRRQHVHSRKRGVEPMPTAGVEALTEWFGGRCAYCQAPATTWDHIVPVADGGRTQPGNILPACVSCNSRKGARDVYDFIDSAGIEVTQALDDALALALDWGQLTA